MNFLMLGIHRQLDERLDVFPAVQCPEPTKWILDKRLEGVAENLRIPALLGRSITEIAFSWGFNDLSHFSRAVRAKFGASPKAFRP